VAILSFVFSFILRQANNIIQAVFGWSVSALFGKLQRRPQILVTTALVLSLAWPLFVLGAFMPRIATWAIALVPLHGIVGMTVMRVIWIALAVASPLVVGALVHVAAPNHKGSLARSMLHGFPIAVGFFAAFITVVVTVPIIKIASVIRRWSDEHVYVQPHDQRYDDVLKALAEAAERAGLEPTISDVPGHLVLATTIMRKLASGAVAPFVSQKLRRITADGIEMYLYPADLLIRGKAQVVAHVRAMFARTPLDGCAYLVGAPEAQAVQDELGRINELLDEHAPSSPQLLVTRLCHAYRQVMTIDIPYDDCVILDAMARRFERRLIAARVVEPTALPLDSVGDHRPKRAESRAAA
jgi:nucleotide-binding universal stress UspA family protein